MLSLSLLLSGIGEIEIPTTGTFIYAFHYLFDIFIHVTLALSVFATSQSALVLIFGPTKVISSLTLLLMFTFIFHVIPFRDLPEQILILLK